MSLLEVEHLRVRFETERGRVQALDDVSFSIEAGSIVGMVGESGSGKTLCALTLLGLLPKTAIVDTGSALFDGVNLLDLSEPELRALRGRRLAMVFQDPLAALDPLLTIGQQLSLVLRQHLTRSRRQARARCAAALGEVGIPEPETRLDLYPHELSGGQRQRVLIAMAILCQPKLLLADEPTTALDVTLQAQILDLFEDLAQRHGTGVLLITHDMGVVARAAREVIVLYAGHVVERAGTDELFSAPLHPYTLALLASVPRLDTRTDAPLVAIPGAPPDPLEVRHGCSFRPRCPFRAERCTRDTPVLQTWQPGLGTAQVLAQLRIFGGRRAACFEMERVALVRQAVADADAESNARSGA